MRPNETLSLGEAAKLAGVHKTTIARKVSEGVIEGNKLEDGSYQIDRKSLSRLYPAVLELDLEEQLSAFHSEVQQAFEGLAKRLKGIEARLIELERS